MKTNVDLRTVDLTSYPDLVVIYLGMRVRTFPGMKTLLGLGPQIDKAGTQRPDGLLHTRIASSSNFIRCILACAGIGEILNRRSVGRAPSPTPDGGRIFCVIQAEPDFGTRSI